MYAPAGLRARGNFLKSMILSQYVKILPLARKSKRRKSYKSSGPGHWTLRPYGFTTQNLRWLLRRGSPLPIPNREVKPACADGTAICGRVCRCLSLSEPQPKRLGFFFFIGAAQSPRGGSCHCLSLVESPAKQPGFLFLSVAVCRAKPIFAVFQL